MNGELNASEPSISSPAQRANRVAENGASTGVPKLLTGGICSSKARREMIEASGRFLQLLGLPRSTGQIFGLLYLTPEPLALDHVAEKLAISRASVSTGLRLLASWGAIRQVWVPGERRDYYEATADLGTLLTRSYADFFKPRLLNSEKRISDIINDLENDRREGLITRAEHDLCFKRLQALSGVQKRIAVLAKLGEKFLK